MNVGNYRVPSSQSVFVDRRESTTRGKTHQITERGGMSTRTNSARVTDNESRLFAEKDGKYD